MPGLERELAADQVELVALRVGQGVVGVVGGPVRAGVRHVLVEEERVEVVRQVVVVGDDRPVAAPAVQRPRSRASEPGPGRRADRPEPGAPQRRSRPRPAGAGADDRAGVDLGRARTGPDAAEPVLEVAVDVEVAADVGPGQPELAGAPERGDASARRERQHHGRGVRADRPRCRPRPGCGPGAHRRKRAYGARPASPRRGSSCISMPGSGGRAGRRRGSRWRSRPRSRRGRTPTSGGRRRRSRARRPRRAHRSVPSNSAACARSDRRSGSAP